METLSNNSFNPLDWIEQKIVPNVEVKRSGNVPLKRSGTFLEQALETVEQMIAHSVNGEKHWILCKASYLLGGYVAGGIVPEMVAIETLQKAIERKSEVQDLKSAFRTIDKCLDAGKSEPVIRNLHQER